jgi:hypothetical protein
MTRLVRAAKMFGVALIVLAGFVGIIEVCVRLFGPLLGPALVIGGIGFLGTVYLCWAIAGKEAP